MDCYELNLWEICVRYFLLWSNCEIVSTVASTITREDMAESELNIDELCVDELKEELRKLNLQVSGSKAVLRERLQAAIRKAKTSTKEGKSKRGEENEDHGENDEEICEDNSDSNSDSEEDDENDATTANRRTRTGLSLTFKDIEDSLQTFSGDGKQNVRKWMEEFEETLVWGLSVDRSAKNNIRQEIIAWIGQAVRFI